jgi:SAM-dependent methyltransferase
MVVLEQLHPDWRDLNIHESSPSNRGASARIAKECPTYTQSQFFPDVRPGTSHLGVRCENLEALTLPDGSIDVFLTQDVLEHVLDPMAVFREVARVLKAGGSHIFTVPITRYAEASRRRARRLPDGAIEHLLPEQYHGNPIDESGALVTIDWGWDITAYVHAASGLFTQTFQIDDLSRGIRAAHIEVYATMKPPVDGLAALD